MKKVLSLILTLNAIVSLGQSKKEQIITLNNRVDSFKLALSEVTQTKLRNEKRDALKINNLKIEIKNSKGEIKELKRKLDVIENQLTGIKTQIKLKDSVINYKDSVINYLVNKIKFYDEDFNKLMFDESGDFRLDTILNHKNWLTLKLKVHGYDGSDESEKYKINGFPEYRLIRYHSFGEIGGENNYFLLKDASLILYFESKYNLDEYKYPDEYEDIIRYNSLTYFGQDLNPKNPKYHKTLQKATAIDNFIDGFIDENELYSRLR